MTRELREASVICRDCYSLVGGREAGDVIRWTTCDDCVRPRRGGGRSMAEILIKVFLVWAIIIAPPLLVWLAAQNAKR